MWDNFIIKAKKQIAVLFVFAVAFLALAAVGLQQQTAQADNVEFHQIGASIRMSDEITGIRFIATINKVDATSDYYVMIIPAKWVETYHLGEEGKEDYYDVLYKAGKRSEIDAEEGEAITMLVMQCTPTLQATGDYEGLYLVRGSIVNVKYANSNTTFFGVAFEQKADKTRVYADRQDEYSYRNITNVASAALNDESGNWKESEITTLKNLVKKAYNVDKGNGENEQVDLPDVLTTMSVYSGTNLAVQNGSTYQASVTGLPDIGIRVGWRIERRGSNKEMNSTIDENGKITVLDENIICDGYAKVLGEEIQFTVNTTKATATGVLEDFASSIMRYNFGHGGAVSDGQIPYTESLDDIGGVSASGIAGVYVSRSSAVQNKDATLRFALSKEDLIAAVSEAETVTVRMMVGTYYRSQDIDGDKVVDLVGRSYTGDSNEKGYVKFAGRDFVVPHNTWVDLTVTKAEFLNFFAGATEAEKLNNFGDLGSNGGTGIANFTVCEDYKVTGYTNSADCEMLFDAIYTDKAEVAPLTSTAVRMNISLKNGAYSESKTDTNDVTVNNVVSVTEYQNYWINARFGFTAEELSKINYLSFKVLVEPSTTATSSYTLRLTRGGGSAASGLIQQSVTCGVWTTITYTKEQLCYRGLNFVGLTDSTSAADWQSAIADATQMAAAWTAFCNTFSSSGDFSQGFLTGLNASNPPIIYIADVAVGYSNIIVKDGALLGSKTDNNNFTVNNVVSVTEKENNGIFAKFDLTAEELSSITSLSFKVLLEPSKSAKSSYPLRLTRGGGTAESGLVQQSVTCGVWTTITYTKAQLSYKCLSAASSSAADWQSAMADETKMAAAWTAFCNAFSSSGNFSTSFLTGVNPDDPPIIYIADVVFNYD